MQNNPLQVSSQSLKNHIPQIQQQGNKVVSTNYNPKSSQSSSYMNNKDNQIQSRSRSKEKVISSKNLSSKNLSKKENNNINIKLKSNLKDQQAGNKKKIISKVLNSPKSVLSGKSTSKTKKKKVKKAPSQSDKQVTQLSSNLGGDYYNNYMPLQNPHLDSLLMHNNSRILSPVSQNLDTNFFTPSSHQQQIFYNDYPTSNYRIPTQISEQDLIASKTERIKKVNDEIFEIERNIADLQRNYKNIMIKLNVYYFI
jgi:hypothetical protein